MADRKHRAASMDKLNLSTKSAQSEEHLQQSFKGISDPDLQVSMDSVGTHCNNNNYASSQNSYSNSNQANNVNSAPIEFASEKRNQDFHQLFRSVPADDPLIEDYTCALQREILIQGRLYVTRKHLAFNSNIFGFVTNLVIAYADILTVERKMTALVIPNSIGITTLHSRFVFSSFMSREGVYHLIMRLWRSALGEDVDGLPWSATLNNENSNATGNGEGDGRSSVPKLTFNVEESMFADSLTQQPASKPMRSVSHASSFLKPNRNSGSVSDSGVEERKQYNQLSVASPTTLSKSTNDEKGQKSTITAGYERDDEVSEQSISPPQRFLRAIPPLIRNATDSLLHTSNDRALKVDTDSAVQQQKKQSFQEKKIADRPPVYCNCQDHYKNIIMDRVFPISLSKMKKIVFDNAEFWKFVMLKRQFTDIQVSSWQEGQRNIEYHVPLNLIIGPRSTKCIATHKIVHDDVENKVCVREVNSSPDIPFATGSAFKTLTSQCMMRAGPKETRLLVAFEIEWLKPNLLRSIIDKTAHGGNIQFWRELELHLLEVIEIENSVETLKATDTSSGLGNKLVRTSSLTSASSDHRGSVLGRLMKDRDFVPWWFYVMFALSLVVLLHNVIFIGRMWSLSGYDPGNKHALSYVDDTSLPKFWFEDLRLESGEVKDLASELQKFYAKFAEQEQFNTHEIQYEMADIDQQIDELNAISVEMQLQQTRV